MFRALAMSKVQLVIPEQIVIPVTEALADSGVFHPMLNRYFSPEDTPDHAGQWRDWVNAFTMLERRIMDVMDALDVDEGTPPAETPHLIEPDEAARDVERLEGETLTCVRELEEQKQRLAQLQRYVSQLQPISELNAELDTVRNLQYLFAMLGTIPIANLERLRSSLEHVPFKLVTLRRDEYLATVVLFGAKRDAEILTRAARSAYLNPLNLPETYQGTPAEAIQSLQANIQHTQARIDALQTDVDRLHEERIGHLRFLLWRLRASRTLAQTIAHYSRLRYTYLVEGWTPAVKISELQEHIDRVSNEVVIEVAPPQSRREAGTPVALEQVSPLRAFQSLVTTYSQPLYGELDPTPLMAVTFPLIFGIMFGDVGHGLVLLLLGTLLASRAVKKLRGMANFGAVVIACGVTSMIFGFLYGSAFGFEDEDILPALWVNPLEDIMGVLIATVGLGAVLLSVGMVVNMANALLLGRWGHALFGHNGLANLIFYWALLGLAWNVLPDVLGIETSFRLSESLVSVLPWVAVAGALMVGFSELLENLVQGHRPLVADSPGTYLVQLPVEIFEMLISLFSNTLSYVRMGAFAVAHGTLSLVVFIIARMAGEGSVGYWAVVVLGNLFVIGFEGMIVGIQTLRLEYYEFFSKFFAGGGANYRPLMLVPRREA
jgi:V/A-type H+-transporting ATPase subunit I